MNRRQSMGLFQGIYFVATGLWPLVHMPSFEAVTEPKTDKWLVRTVGVLVGVVGGVLVSAAARNKLTPEMTALAVGSAASLGVVDAWYASRGRIADSYFVDAAVEGLIVAGWVDAAVDRQRRLRDASDDAYWL